MIFTKTNRPTESIEDLERALFLVGKINDEYTKVSLHANILLNKGYYLLTGDNNNNNNNYYYYYYSSSNSDNNFPTIFLILLYFFLLVANDPMNAMFLFNQSITINPCANLNRKII